MAIVSLTAYDSPVTIMSTELNGLAAGNETALVLFNNTTNKRLYMTIQLDLASVNLSAETVPSCTLRHVVETAAGTPDAKVGGTPYTLWFAPGVGAATHRSPGVRVVLDPGYNYFSVLSNMTAAALAGTGNTLVGVAFSEQA